jgi:hypothetical protein
MEMHDLTNLLQRLEIQATLLKKKDFSEFSREEIIEDVKKDLEKLRRLFNDLSSD